VSTYPTAPAQGHTSTGAAPERPGTLKTAVALAVVAGLAAIGNAVIMLTGGAKLLGELAKQEAGDVAAQLGDLGVDADSLGNAVGSLVGDVFKSRSYVAIFSGALLLLFGLAMINAATWARVLVTIFAVPALGISGIIALDVATGLMKTLGWLGVICSILVIIFAWLRPNGRYGKARKAYRAQTA
jgi:hypothetical protein